jgi:hypothetical protein
MLYCYAQSDNSYVTGTVKDSSGSIIPNAKVTVRNEANSAERVVVTNATGVYIASNLPPGLYTVIAEAAGFKKFESTKNKMDAASPLTVNVDLTVGSVSDTVNVEATATQLQTESGVLGKTVEGKQISELQLNGRNPIFLALLKPGVRGGSLAGFNFGLGTGGFAINGSRSQDNLITYDGAVGIRTRSNGESIGTADLDNTAEVQILTAAYGAEYGRSGGGQIRVVTKSGTSQFHGSAYEYFRNNAMDANSWQRNRSTSTNFTTPFKFNQFGYNLSGPIFIPGKFNRDRNKLFFTWNQEWAKRRQDSQQNQTVPSALMKTGNFSELLGPSFWFSSARLIKDPTTGQNFPGNIIPTNRLSPNGIALLKVYPDPNIVLGNQNWFAVRGAPIDQRKDSWGIDWLPTSKDTFKWRGSMFNYLDVNPFQTGFTFSSRTFDRPNQTTSLNWTHVFTPTMILETLLTASRDQVFIRMTDSPAFDRGTYGINYPYLFGSATKDRPNKLPAISLPGFAGYSGSPYPSNSTGPIYGASTNLTKILSAHTLKFGFLFERAGQNDYDQINVQGVPGGTDNQNGRFEFLDGRPGGSGVAIGDAALGLFANYAEIGVRSYTPYRGHMYEMFAQDEWKVNSKLKVTLGARYTIVQPYYSLWGNMTVFDRRYYDPAKAVQVDRATGNPIPGTGDQYNGVVIPGSSFPDSAKGRVPIADSGEFNNLFRGLPRHYSDIDYKNIQPRLGFAYQVTPKTVFRAGGGKYSTRLGVSDSVFLGGNPPLQPIASIPTGSVDNPGGGARVAFPLSINTQSLQFVMPQAYNWNFTVEREIMSNTVLSASYVGRRGLHGQREKNINQLPIGTLQANPGVNANALRPYKGFGPIRETYNDANSMYNGFQLELNRRFSNGLSYGFAYTLSKCSDGGSAQRDVVPDAYDTSFIYGPCNFDTRHVAVINFIYRLPFFEKSGRALKAVAGGWQISGVTQFQTGTPVTVQTGDDFAGIGPGSGNQISYFWRYANLNSGADYPKQFAFGGNADPAQYLTVRDGSGNLLFTPPAAGTMVKDRMRNYFYNPGFQNWNLGLFKTFAITEKQTFLLRFEAFNWLNHPNWDGMNTDPRAQAFGKVTTKSSQRNLQISVRYAF